MAPPIRPLPRLKQLMREHGTTVTIMAGVIHRSRGYLQKRLDADTYVLDLPIDEVDRLAGFFGVPVAELGG